MDIHSKIRHKQLKSKTIRKSSNISSIEDISHLHDAAIGGIGSPSKNMHSTSRSRSRSKSRTRRRSRSTSSLRQKKTRSSSSNTKKSLSFISEEQLPDSLSLTNQQQLSYTSLLNDMQSSESSSAKYKSYVDFKNNIKMMETLQNQGGFGTASKVIMKNGKEYFLKIIENDERNREKTYSEIIVLKKLKNTCQPYIQCYEQFFIEGNKIYIITEFLTGYVELFDFISNNDNITNEIYAKIIDKLCRGLIEIHEQNIAHRDIKPENIMIQFENEDNINIKYIDFGLSCDNDNVNKINCNETSLGTAMYLDPIIRSKKNTTNVTFEDLKKGDIWSLGITILVMISKMMPTYLYGIDTEKINKTERDIYTIVIMNHFYKTINNIPLNEPEFDTDYYNKIHNILMKFIKEKKEIDKYDILNIMNDKITKIIQQNDEICKEAEENGYYSLDLRNALSTKSREITIPNNK